MNKPNRADVRQVNVKVSGIAFESVRVRHDLGSNDFDIVIDDPNLGRFALTQFDGCNGQAVQLLQGKYRLPRTKS